MPKSQNNTKSNGLLINRCDWVTHDPIYIDYHDHEWGIPQYNSQKLFEKLCLEGQQAGLSWITVLKKRDCYRHYFYQFNAEKIALLTPQDIDKFMTEPGLIRHRLKLESIVKNARAYLKMQENGEDLSDFIWSFVNHQPLDNMPTSLQDIPIHTTISDKMSKALKKRGFSFVGSTSCYAFMQSVGLVNDHFVDCFCRHR